MTGSKEKRRFFRIDDEVDLFYRKIDQHEAAGAGPAENNVLTHYSLSAALEMLSQESTVLLRRLEKSQPDVVNYLKLIDRKIGLLAQAIITQDSAFREKNARNVNLSAAGLAFESEEALKPGEFLEIKMWLVSCMAMIVTYGKVIYCNEQPAADGRYPYRIGVDYIGMEEQDRELLIKHVVKRQLQQIRDKKEAGHQS
ncbi:MULTISPECIES: PilZ domain-containing protein [Methylobacter]|jgi:hypothetical protein|uniref:PilZ domain-containing protein n=1 Tax=Methylobacter TaxID=429 RepID=UPI0003607635|nr:MULTISPECIES: PilZ domain-containing protein [Methylobacter]